jgi:hypothetical protein
MVALLLEWYSPRGYLTKSNQSANRLTGYRILILIKEINRLPSRKLGRRRQGGLWFGKESRRLQNID